MDGMFVFKQVTQVTIDTFVGVDEFCEPLLPSHFSSGLQIPEKPTFDWKKLIANKNKELDRLTGIYGRILSGADVELITGRGSIVDKHTVDVDGKQYTAKNILIATGMS